MPFPRTSFGSDLYNTLRTWSAFFSKTPPSIATAVAIFTLGPIATMIYRPISYIYLLLGSGAWVISIGIKRHGSKFIVLAVDSLRLSDEWRATFIGIWSAFTELGLTLILLTGLSHRLDFLKVFAFGLGSASIEVFSLFWIASIRRFRAASTTKNKDLPNLPFIIRNMFLIERVLTGGIHISSRVLIYESVIARSMLPGAVATVLFAVIDGVAYFGHLKQWDWLVPKTGALYFGMVALFLVLQISMIPFCK